MNSFSSNMNKSFSNIITNDRDHYTYQYHSYHNTLTPRTHNQPLIPSPIQPKQEQQYNYNLADEEMLSLKNQIFSFEKSMKNYHKLQSDYRSLSNNIAMLNETKHHLNHDLNLQTQRINNQIASLTNHSQSLQSKLNVIQKEALLMSGDHTHLQSNLSIANQDIESLSASLKQKEALALQLKADIDQMKRQANVLESTNKHDNDAIRHKEKMLLDEAKASKSKEGALREMSNMNNDIKAQCNDCIRKNNDLMTACVTKGKENEDMMIVLNMKERQGKDVSERVRKGEEELEEIGSELVEKVKELQKNEEVNKELKRDVGLKEMELKNKGAQVKNIKERIGELLNNKKNINEELIRDNSQGVKCKDALEMLMKYNKSLAAELTYVIDSDKIINERLSAYDTLNERIAKIKNDTANAESTLENELEFKRSHRLCYGIDS